MTRSRRILILAPHPDDEVVACGVVASRARAAGARVFVLHLTTGLPRAASRPGSYAARVARRRAEAAKAAALLGLTPTGFLDIPARRLLDHLDEAAAAANSAIGRIDPDCLWVPAFEGAHQDHDAASALAARCAGGRPVREFAAYNLAGGRVRSNRFAGVRGGETVAALAPDEIALKRRALDVYASERRNLGHIRLVEEAWRPLPAHDYAAPPHPGTLFRERFQWVPFRHPRIDFAPSAEVYRRLGRWAGAAALDSGEPSAGDGFRQHEGVR